MTCRPMLVGIVAVLAIAPVGAAEAVAISFGTPAQANGGLEGAGFQWALLYLGPAQLRLMGVLTGEVQNHTFSEATLHVPEAGTFEFPGGWQPSTPVQLAGLFTADLSFDGGRPAAIFIEAESITFGAGPFRGQLVQVREGDDAEAPLPSGSGSPAMRARPIASEGVGLGLREPGETGTIRLRAEGLRRAEWFGGSLSCPESNCPAGGGKWNETIRTPRGDRVETARLSWMDLRAAGGQAELAGIAWAVSAGGSSPDVVVRGDLRLPAADNPAACEECVVLNEGTLALSGEVSLARLSSAGQGRLQANLGGTAVDARIDEEHVDPALLGLALAPAAVAGIAAVAVVGKLLALFSRALRDPLSNPRRRAVYDAIRANPGLAIRELLRITGLANGVASHHVRTLAQRGLIVRHKVGKTVRLFENHGRYDRDWQTVAALRDPDARLLHAWLKANGKCIQLDVITAATDWGWSPTATKRRLGALVEAGLAATVRQGRVRWYMVP